jgi:hypothetical protein
VDIQQFWELIGEAHLPDIPDTGDWSEALETTLGRLEPAEIVEWNHIFDQFAKDAYTIDLMAACWLINGGAGDDGFYYFRCWLIGMGKEVYEAALANSDSLANVVDPRRDAEAEIYAAAHFAWMKVTGKSDTEPYPARDEHAQLQGVDWDFEDKEQQRKRLPRLSKMYGH